MSFFPSFFSYVKLENRRAEQVCPWWRGLLPVGEGRRWGNAEARQICCKYCVYMYIKRKMIPVETIPGIGEREMKENGVGAEFKYDTLDIL
jgi:hypothetical protein